MLSYHHFLLIPVAVKTTLEYFLILKIVLVLIQDYSVILKMELRSRTIKWKPSKDVEDEMIPPEYGAKIYTKVLGHSYHLDVRDLGSVLGSVLGSTLLTELNREIWYLEDDLNDDDSFSCHDAMALAKSTSLYQFDYDQLDDYITQHYHDGPITLYELKNATKIVLKMMLEQIINE